MGILQDWSEKLGFGPGNHEDQNTAEDLLAKAAKYYDDVKVPELQAVNLLGQQYQGDVDPSHVNFEGASAVNAGPTELANISADPRLRSAQMKALSQMQDVADQGGLTAQDKADLARTSTEAANADAGRRAAILQNMQARGMGGSGAELLAQLSSSQAATDRAAQAGLDVNAQAQNRALQAMMSTGTMAGNLRSQDYGEQSNAAQAQDAINKFNAQNQTGMNQFNATAANNAAAQNASLQQQANMFNQGQKQNVANANTATQNQQTMYNQAQVPQQNFNNQMAVAGGKSGQAQSASNYHGNKYNTQEQTKAAKQGSIIGGLAGLGQAAILSDKRCKTGVKSVKPAHVDAFIKSLKPKTFKYKDPSNGEGTYPGVMAQDMENSDLGKLAVVPDVDGEGHKGIDQTKLNGLMLAAIKRVSDKTKKGAA